MGINLTNFLSSQSKNTKMIDFQDLDHLDGLSISVVSANLYKVGLSKKESQQTSIQFSPNSLSWYLNYFKYLRSYFFRTWPKPFKLKCNEAPQLFLKILVWNFCCQLELLNRSSLLLGLLTRHSIFGISFFTLRTNGSTSMYFYFFTSTFLSKASNIF